MKKMILLVMTSLFLAFVLVGCSGKESADAYVGEQITKLKEDGASGLSVILDEGIAESNETYILQFPEELKESYLEFLQASFKNIEFEVQKAKKDGDDKFSVRVGFTPLNIGNTTQDARELYLTAIASNDLTVEVGELLEQLKDIVADSPVYDPETFVTIEVEKDGDGFKVKEEDVQELLRQAFEGSMAPYDSVCEILDVQDFLKAYLDASYKGEVAQFAKHTDRTEEEAAAWYEAEAFDAPYDLSASYVDRYKAALKEIVKQCQYTVGMPKKESGIYNYTIDVTVVPNNSLVDAMAELEGGTYYSIDAVSQGLVEILERYAEAPSFGEETVVTVTLNLDSLFNANANDSELSKLADIILVPAE